MNTTPQLSAAEIKTLEEPQTEQVRQALSLFLKELILLGWVNTKRGKRPLHSAFGWFVLFTIIILCIYFFIGIILAIFLAIYAWEAKKDQTLLFVSAEGEQKLNQTGKETPALVQMLKTVANARPNDMDHCTSQEWRKHLALYYPNNASFHKEFLLAGLMSKGLVEMDANQQPKRTAAGDAVLYKAKTAIEKGQELPALLREGSPSAAAMAAQLSGLVLLIPGIEGYFGQLFQHTGYLDSDLLEQEKQRLGQGTDGGSDSGGSTSDDTRDDHDAEGSMDNGSDWQNDADFLDGIDADTGDSGIGSDAGGGDSGDGGDGGGDGGCSGCGGCGGGD
ncbi:MAG TPA: hypothetical protein VK168_07875 [Saprospiraceae bacterium]|nr:hypothetical protein [Saprospiraceae bacterium]